jgi:hypothetical protein
MPLRNLQMNAVKTLEPKKERQRAWYVLTDWFGDVYCGIARRVVERIEILQDQAAERQIARQSEDFRTHQAKPVEIPKAVGNEQRAEG